MSRTIKGNIKQEIGARLHLLRLKNNLSQTELGRQLGVTFQQIQKYEKGTNTVSSARLQLLCEILHCTPAELIMPTTTERKVFAQLSHRAIRTAIRIDQLDHVQQIALNKIIDALEENK
jgi:transcriptional regulator with XRE-family HTH domain